MAEFQIASNTVDTAREHARTVLFDAVGDARASPALSKSLIRLRRTVRDLKVAGAYVVPDQFPRRHLVESAMNSLDATLVTTERLRLALGSAFADEERRHLHTNVGLASDPHVLHGLLTAAPSLELVLARRALDGRPLEKKIAMRLATFLARVAAKTSPYSTFTRTAQGSLTTKPKGSDVQLKPTVPVLQLDGRLWTLILEDIRHNAAFEPHLFIRVNPSANETQHGIEFVGSTPRESILRMPSSGLLRTMLNIPSKPQSVGGWAQTLEEHGVGRTDALDMVRSLLQAGFLQSNVPVSDNALRPLTALNDWLSTLDRVVTQALSYGHVLEQLQNDLEECSLTIFDQTAQRERITRAIRSASTILALVAPPDLAHSISVDVIHESAVVLDADWSVSTDGWGDALPELDVARSWLSQFDPKLPGRLAVEDFAASFMAPGERTSLLEFYRAISTALQTPESPRTAPLKKYFSRIPRQPVVGDAADPPRLRQLAALRADSFRLVDQFTFGGHSVIPPAEVTKVFASWPRWLGIPESAACYVQPIARINAPCLLAINVIHGGNGRGRARTNFMLRSVDAEFPVLSQSRQTNARQAEYSGTHGSSLNVRGSTTEWEIDYPFTYSARPLAERIPISALAVERPSSGDGLVLIDDRFDSVVVPAHVGMLADYQLPPLARFLERVFANTYLLHPSAPPFASNFRLDEIEETVVVPRIQVGRVVIQRQRWIVPAPLFPAQDASESRPVFWYRLREWFASSAIPERSFARAWGQELSGDKAKSRKPVFLDLDSWWGIADYLRHGQNCDFYVFDEALPDPMDGDPSEFVSEILIESQTPVTHIERERASR
ncbi:lantibiotic dehydratase [Cryobacterium sp. N21]|uniref:lantibiotic dehydratase n=1 Tax=Cryobacterium sp. N21 TaxID=2048289 RepID=UPI0013048C32|nr:lantibiotic dehydratase [Cryobacterium sp. N21]